MPYKSDKQRKYMYAKLPMVAEKFEKKTPKGKKPPAKYGKYKKGLPKVG